MVLRLEYRLCIANAQYNGFTIYKPLNGKQNQQSYIQTIKTTKQVQFFMHFLGRGKNMKKCDLILLQQMKYLELQQMEDILQSASNEHRTIYYAVQLKIMEIKQSIRMKGIQLTSNEVKTGTAEMINHLYMLESIFHQSRTPHIYQLVKDITVNFNSVVAILLEKIDRSQKEYVILMNTKAEEKTNAKTEENLESSNRSVKGRKKNGLGGIHLYNEDYTRYIQDQMILQQIKIEKERRLQRKRKDILLQSILDELNHQTDVEQFPANSDDIANYIIRTKDKASVFNYVSYEPELQSILTFFQNSQNQANHFLLRKARGIQDEDGNFSFADFHRDVLMKNAAFRKQVAQKLKDFISKYRNKQKELQTYFITKQNESKEQKIKDNKTNEEVQTGFNFVQFEKDKNQQIRQLEEKCLKLQTMSRLKNSSEHKQSQLVNQISKKQTQIDKSNRKVTQLQTSLQYIKQLFKDQKLKKSYMTRQEIMLKSQKNIAINKENQEDLKRKIQEKYSALQDSPSVKSNDVLRKTQQSKTKYLKKNQVNDTASFFSFNEEQKNKDIAVKYQFIKQMQDGYNKQPQKMLQSMKKKEEIVEMRYINSEIRTQQTQIDKEQISQLRNTANSFKNLKKSQKEIKVKTLKTLKSNKTLKSEKQIKFQIKQTEYSQKQQQDKEQRKQKKQQQKTSYKNIVKQKKSQIGSTMINSQVTSLPYTQNQYMKNSCKIKEVMQQCEQETVRQSSSNNFSMNSLSSLKSQQQLMSKINAQLKKIKEQHAFTYHQVFSITLNPTNKQKMQQRRTLLTQSNQPPQDISQVTVMKAFDSLLKYEVNPTKIQKIKKWRRLMQSHLKSEYITPAQLRQIMCVIQGSAYNKSNSQLTLQKGANLIGKISTNIRNSLKEMTLVPNASQKVRLPLVKGKEKSPQHQDKNIKQIDSQIQQKIMNLIRAESLQTGFAVKFNTLHKNCCQGIFCSHIHSYLQRITKHFQQKQKKERKSLILPVQRIGTLTKNEQIANQKQERQTKGRSQHKQNSMPRKNYSLITHKSQNTMLPNISNYKSNNYRSFINMVA